MCNWTDSVIKTHSSLKAPKNAFTSNYINVIRGGNLHFYIFLMKSSACGKCIAVMHDVFARLLLCGSGWLLGGIMFVDMVQFFQCGSVGFLSLIFWSCRWKWCVWSLSKAMLNNAHDFMNHSCWVKCCSSIFIHCIQTGCDFIKRQATWAIYSVLIKPKSVLPLWITIKNGLKNIEH